MLARMDYEINTWDTLERIAASHDCTVGELMKLNRMASRIVFPGMKIRVPFPSDDVFDSAQDSRHKVAAKQPSIGSESAEDGIRKGPGGAVPSIHTPISKQNDRSRAPTIDSVELDAECLQRFLKVKVKQLTETDGTVGGTLLVTPNCLMFDPDVTHALVREKGSDLYGMVANMDDIMAVTLYRDIGALTGDTDQQKDVYDPDRVAVEEGVSGAPPEEVLPLIVEEELANVSERPGDSTVQRRHNSDLTAEAAVYGPDDAALLATDGPDSRSCPSLSRTERQRAQSDLLASTTANGGNEQKGSRISPRSARRSVVRLGRTLSSRAYSFGGTVASGAQSVAQTAVSSTKSAAHGVVTHTKSAADTLQTGAKAAAGAVASVPQNIVNMSSGLFAPESVGPSSGVLDVHDTWFGNNEEAQKSPTSMKRQQSLATLESLRVKTQQAREEASSKQNKLKFSCATSLDEMPELFRPVQDMLPTTDETCASPELPFYLCVRLTRRRKRKRGSAPSVSNDDSAFGNQLKREFWFAVPRERAEAVYHFLLQWRPDKYGQDSNAIEKERDEKGFLIIEGDDDDALAGDKPSTPLFGSLLNREWEIVTVEEMRRRLSLSELSLEDLPLPDGATTSRILEEPMIRQLLEILPARAEGYPWIQVYSSADHGFSLNTLYRKMGDWDEEVSPTLLIVRDISDRVFGAIVSCPLRPAEHFYGTGDSCLLWRVVGDTPHTRQVQSWTWTGDNQLFVKASKDSLAIGAGGGHYGLWLDADLNHGRSQRCATFDNENLAGPEEDFIIQQIEAFGFRML